MATKESKEDKEERERKEIEKERRLLFGGNSYSKPQSSARNPLNEDKGQLISKYRKQDKEPKEPIEKVQNSRMEQFALNLGGRGANL